MLDPYTEDLVSRKCLHEVHTSERMSFRACRRRWGWIFQDGFYPTETAKPLEFGTAFHAAMETLFNPATWNYNHIVLGALAEKTFVEMCRQQLKDYLRLNAERALDNLAQEDYDERIELGRGMIRYFVEKQLPDIQKEYTPYAVELSFDVLLTDQNGQFIYCKCKACRKEFAKRGGGKWKGNPVAYSGRVDVIMHDARGDYWIWDWKTTAQFRSSEAYWELDDQVASYCWAFRRALGLNIRGFIIHEQRKDYPQPPNENKVRRLGRMFSVNQQQATDYETYRDWVAKYDTSAYEAGFYDDHLSWLQASGVQYYRRFKIYKTDYELYQVEQNLLAEALEMINPNLRVYPTPGRFTCDGCAFQVPCQSKNSGADYEYTLQTLYLRQEPYYRRNRPASTESRGGR